jgi:hypothetical protein
MQIVCTTAQAAAHVLTILYTRRLQPVRDFAIHPILSIRPPITFTIRVALPTTQVSKIGAIPDVTVIG